MKEMVGKDLCTNSTHNTYTGRAEDSPGVVVVVEDAGGAVETERGGWDVGATAEDEEEEGEGVADAAPGKENIPIRAHTDYSGTSKERTFWERHFCPLFRGCPLLGGCLIFALYPPPRMIKNILCDMVVHYELGEVSDDTV